MPFISTADGTRLHWHEWGEGAPMLFLSSLGMAGQMWQYQMAAFAERGFRCIALDRRGHGRSDQPTRGYDHDTHRTGMQPRIGERGLSPRDERHRHSRAAHPR